MIGARMKQALAIAAACAAMFRAAPAMAQHAAGTARGASANHPTGVRAETTQSTEGVVNINAASEEELRRLPGVGPSRAAAIVALRQRVQRFHTADDLLRVRGLGRAGMRRMRQYVSLSGDTTLASRPGRTSAPSAQEGGAN